MGFRFRKSVGFGPFRINFSKSGVGYSVGGKGVRFTKKAKGGFRSTVSAPGTGLSYSKDFGGKKSNAKSSSQKQAAAPAASGQQKSPKKQFTFGESLIALVLIFILVGASSCSNDSDKPAEQAEQPVTTVEQTEEQPKAEPEKPDSYTLDYPDAESFESALNNGEKVNGKTVQFVVNNYEPDSKLGFNCWAGEHLNFISDSGLDVSSGNIIIGQISEEPSDLLGSWIIPYKVLTVEEPKEQSTEQSKTESTDNAVVAAVPTVQQPEEQPKVEQPKEQPAAQPEAKPEEQPAAQPEAKPEAKPEEQPKAEQTAPAAAETPKEQPKAEQPATAPKAESEKATPAAAAPAENKEAAYVLNTDSKKFHYPSCSSAKKISPENRGSCNSREEAIAMGYDPCGRCKP